MSEGLNKVTETKRVEEQGELQQEEALQAAYTLQRKALFPLRLGSGAIHTQ